MRRPGVDLEAIARRVAGKLPVDKSLLAENEKVISDAVQRVKQKLDTLARREQKGDLRDALKKFNEVVGELNKVINAIVKGHSEVKKPADKVLDRLHKLHESVKPLRLNIEKT